MIQTREISSTLTELYTEDGFIHRIGSDIYFKRGCVKTADVSEYEWMTEQPKYTKEEYNKEVERLIAEHYTKGQEIQFAREQSEAGEKYAEYLAYVENCKERAKRSLAERKTRSEPLLGNNINISPAH